MDLSDLIGSVILTGVVTASAAVVWLIGIVNWHESRTTPAVHHPARYFHLRQQDWDDTPCSVGDWVGYGHTTGDVAARPTAVAEVTALSGGASSDSDDSSRIDGILTLRLADGSTSRMRTDIRNPRTVQPGTFLPFHPAADDTEPSDDDLGWDLDTTAVRDLLLVHRLQLGLLSIDEADALLTVSLAGERPKSARVHGIRPTGMVRHGHVEVELIIGTRDGWVPTRTFLRPEDVATVRHNGRVLAVRVDTASTSDPRWVVWPRWH